MHASNPSDHDCRTPVGAGQGISLVLPAWNEQDVILQAIGEAEQALSRLTDDYEIIVVDDGSSDSTSDLVEAVSQRNRHVRLIRHDSNLGYGAALRNGFRVATPSSAGSIANW